MDGLTLLDEARAVGLAVTREGDLLKIRGPRRAEAIAQQLISHKALVMQALDREAAPESSISQTGLPADWHFLWDERAAIMEYEGGLPRDGAESLALKDIMEQMERAGIDTSQYRG